MNSRKLLLTAAVLALMPVAACSGISTPGPRPVDLSYTQLQPLSLNVGQVQVNNMAPAGKTNNPSLEPSPALERYARQRFQGNMGDGILNVNIEQASMRSAEVAPTGDWTEKFRLSKPIEYTVTMRVGLDLQGKANQPGVKSAYTLERKKTLPDNASLADRDREISDLIASMIRDLDGTLQNGVSQNMHILQYASPMSPPPAPVRAAPSTPQPLATGVVAN